MESLFDINTDTGCRNNWAGNAAIGQARNSPHDSWRLSYRSKGLTNRASPFNLNAQASFQFKPTAGVGPSNLDQIIVKRRAAAEVGQGLRDSLIDVAVAGAQLVPPSRQ